MNATSSSDRYDAARKALNEMDKAWTDKDERYAGVKCAIALRALIEPPATKETPEQIANRTLDKIYGAGVWSEGSSASMAEVFDAALTGIRAGIQAAWESREPENSPAPAFKPEGEPDKYRDMWGRIDDNSQEFTLDIHSHHHEVTITELTRGQARRILEMLSSEEY